MKLRITLLSAGVALTGLGLAQAGSSGSSPSSEPTGSAYTSSNMSATISLTGYLSTTSSALSASTSASGTLNLVNGSISNGLALTPPMGFSTWNEFGIDINETMMKSTMDFFVSSGLRDAGYIYINLDDGWQQYPGNRSDHPGPIAPNTDKFPSGIKALADYAHERGLKMGIYSGPGDTTCAGFIGSLGHEKEDADTFASWGIDHLKYDACCWIDQFAPEIEVQTAMLIMSEALIETYRPIVFHMCYCGWANIAEWAAGEGANQWRIGQDISDDFNYPGQREKYYNDVLGMIDIGNNLTQYSGPGHWNDYDMLIIGLNGESENLVGIGCSNIEYRTHVSMWAMVASPMLIGSDARTLSSYDLETLLNPEMIAISQDPLGVPATTCGVGNQATGDLQVYGRPLNDGSWAVALLNRGSFSAEMNFYPPRDITVGWYIYRVRDVWAHEDHGPFASAYTTEVRPHEAKILRVYQGYANATMWFP